MLRVLISLSSVELLHVNALVVYNIIWMTVIYNIVRITKSRKVILNIGERRNTYKDLIGKPEGRDLSIDEKLLIAF